jgi:hypothetical protein
MRSVAILLVHFEFAIENDGNGVAQCSMRAFQFLSQTHSGISLHMYTQSQSGSETNLNLKVGPQWRRKKLDGTYLPSSPNVSFQLDGITYLRSSLTSVFSDV